MGSVSAISDEGLREAVLRATVKDEVVPVIEQALKVRDRPVVIDKNRGWAHYFEWVAQWCPGPKMICMVRDLRSVVASMERIYRANR